MNCLPVKTLERISEEIKTGRPILHIAKDFKVSKRLVHNLKNGRIDLDKRRKVRSREEQEVERKITMDLYSRPFSRCGYCGSLVQKPCLLCCLSRNDLKALEPLLMEEDDDEDRNYHFG